MDDYEGTGQNPEPDYGETDPELFDQGFRRELKDAVNAALIRDGVPVGETRVIDTIEVYRARQNPLHDYKVNF
ncbi:MAG: hypothetical protein EHM63_07135 [Actinobacteria bacterium]|nr:MAG: hypothetical protein EHM63_07135 [Actinomycetota bacterium]